jgi:transposase-like protein
MSEREIERLRRDLERGSRRRQRRRYPRELRERAVAYAREARARGESEGEIARTLGVNRQTFAKWDKQLGGMFRSVELVRETTPVTSESLVAVTPGGLRIEGLDLERAAELIRRVG